MVVRGTFIIALDKMLVHTPHLSVEERPPRAGVWIQGAGGGGAKENMHEWFCSPDMSGPLISFRILWYEGRRVNISRRFLEAASSSEQLSSSSLVSTACMELLE